MAYDNLLLKDTTSKIIEITLRDSTTGQGKTGVSFASVTGSYCREGGTRVAITMASGTAGDAYSSGKWCEVDATNMPGLYQVHIPNAALATGVNGVTLQFKVSGAIDKVVKIGLVGANIQDAVRLGLTALPNVASGSAGAIITSGTGTAQLSTSSGQVLLQSGTSAGQLDFTSGIVKADVHTIKTQTVTCAAGVTVLASVGTAATSTAQTGDAFARIGANGAGLTALGDTRLANLDVASSTLATAANLATVAGYLDTEIAAIKAKTDNLPAAPAAVGDIPSAATIADAVWDEATSGHATAGTTGAALIAAGSAGDPWATALPGAYSAGTAGNIIGNRIDVASSTLATATNLATLAGYVDTEVAAIKAKTDNLPASPAATGDIPTANENADALLARNIAGGSSSGRTVTQALCFLRNKWTVAAGTLTVYGTDDSTTSWTATVSTDAAALPVTGNDPA